MPSEDDLIAWLKERTAATGGRWIGDDAAILPQSDRWAVTMDTQIEGTHFFSGLSPELIARRLLAVNLSDLAAMGAMPSFAFLALSAPETFDHRSFFVSLVEACEAIELELAGGDLSQQPRVAAVLTLLGSKPTERRWLYRDSAQAGESIWLGGTVGEASAGLKILQQASPFEERLLESVEELGIPHLLAPEAKAAVHRHLLPNAQLQLGSWLGSRDAGAAIDISDGLAVDLHRLCYASRVGARIYLDRLPLPKNFRELARAIKADWKGMALAGGEDYVLLFTLPSEVTPPPSFNCTRIGSITESELTIVDQDGEQPLLKEGWDHLAPGTNNMTR